MLKLLIAAALIALLGLNLLFVSAVFALTQWLPGWLAALGLAGMLLAIELRSRSDRLGATRERTAGYHPKNCQGRHAMGEGTTRVVDANGAGAKGA